MQLVSKISNLCDPDPPTLQTDRRTDTRTDRQTDGRHAISIPRYALVHRAVKTLHKTCYLSNSIDPVVRLIFTHLSSSVDFFAYDNTRRAQLTAQGNKHGSDITEQEAQLLL